MQLKLNPMKKVRERRGLSLTALAFQLDSTKSHLSKVEHGHCQASPDLANRIAKFFGNEVTRDQILFPDDYIDGARMPARKPVQSVDAEAV